MSVSFCSGGRGNNGERERDDEIQEPMISLLFLSLPDAI